jgi:hypothetical protein
MWRETLLMLLYIIGIGMMGSSIMIIVMDNPSDIRPILPLAVFGIISFIMSFALLNKLGMSRIQFVDILKSYGFQISDEKGSNIYGMTSDNVLFKGWFSGRYFYIPQHDYFSSFGNLSFYFPGTTPDILDHYIIKSNNRLKVGAYYLLGNDRMNLDINERIPKLFSDICNDIEFLTINRIYSGPGYIYIQAGPPTLSYGNYAKNNIEGVMKFINGYRKYFKCENMKWEADINMYDLKNNIEVMETNRSILLRKRWPL